ncbi:MAG TPA: TolC family protein [Flavobacterium sp.]|nr:TolC family protein [Flavobacterium sp.]
MKQLTLLFFFIPLLSVFSQDGKPQAFSLRDAISYGLEHNYDAVNASRDIDKAKARKWETTSTGLPQISGNVNYVNNFKLQKSVIPGEIFGGAPGSFVEVAFGTRHTMAASATLSQLIFDGSYIVALQAAKTYLAYYQNAKQKSDLDIREQIINAYGTVLMVEENIRILESNRSSLQKTFGDTRETFRNGLVEEETVEQLQITLASVQSSLDNARRLRDIAYEMLKLSMGIDLSEQIVLTDQLDTLTTSNMDLALTQPAFNLENNIDYQIAKNFRDQRLLEYKLERSKALPSLSANVNLGTNAFGNQFDFFQGDKKWFDYSNVGLNLNVPIFSSFGRKARTDQARIALEQAKTQLTQAEQALRLEFERAKSEYDFSISQYQTAKENLALAERIERKQQTKFTEGLSSSFDLSDAQRQLYSAQQQYLQSMVDIINKKAAFEKIINQSK